MFPDLLFTALTYPDGTPERAIRSATALTRRLQGALTLLTVRIDIPDVGNAVSNALFRFDQVAAEVESRSVRRSEREARCMRIAAEEAGVTVSVRDVTTPLHFEIDTVVTAARTRDLSLVSIGPAVLADRGLAEALLFRSGRPVVVFPEEVEMTPRDAFGAVLIAWNGSPQAARAVAEALPILRRAKSVRIAVAPEAARKVSAGAADDLVRHLKAHGVVAEVDVLEAEKPAGQLICDEVRARGVDLLVMGGYGHSRLHEFVLGGATETILDAPPCAVMLAH